MFIGKVRKTSTGQRVALTKATTIVVTKIDHALVNFIPGTTSEIKASPKKFKNQTSKNVPII